MFCNSFKCEISRSLWLPVFIRSSMIISVPPEIICNSCFDNIFNASLRSCGVCVFTFVMRKVCLSTTFMCVLQESCAAIWLCLDGFLRLIPRKTFSKVRGNSYDCVPTANLSALLIAEEVNSKVGSPKLLAPNGPSTSSFSINTGFMFPISLIVGIK